MYVVIILFLLWLVFVLFCLWYAIDRILCKEDYVTNKTTTNKIIRFLNTQYSQHSIFYDLGSSRGGFALELSKKCPQLQIIGIDNSLLRVWISKLRGWLQNRKVTFIKGDIFLTDLSKANLLYVYIPRILLSTLAAKLEKELRPNAVVITSRISFSEWQPNEIIRNGISTQDEEDIFIYKSPFIKSHR